MKKILKLENQTPEYLEFTWLGFNTAIYREINDSKNVSWVSDKKGNCVRIKRTDENEINRIVFLLEDIGYEIDEEIRNIISQKENSCSEKAKLTPRDYQIEDSMIMLKAKRMLNFSEMGTGKTVTTILCLKRIDGKKIIVCPSSMVYIWALEISRMVKDEEIGIFDKKDMTSIHNDWLIISYDQLRINSYLINLPFVAAVFDEAQYIKSVTNWGEPGSKRAKVCLELAEKCEYVYALTGSPIYSHVKDLYNLLRIVRANDLTFHENFFEFGRYYCNGKKIHIGGGKKVWDFNGSSNEEKLSLLLKKYSIRREKKNVLPNLTKIRQTIPVPVKETEEMKLSSKNFNAKLMHARIAIAEAKVKSTIELAKTVVEGGEQVVIFSSFLSCINKICSSLKKSVKIVGEMSNKQRSDAILRFQNCDAEVCVVSTMAGAVGITLHASHVVIFSDIPFCPSDIFQAEDRVCRMGQTEVCNVYTMLAIGSEVDELMQRIISRKLQSINKVMQTDIKEELFEEIKKKEKDENERAY